MIGKVSHMELSTVRLAKHLCCLYLFNWCFVCQIAMSDVGESLSFDPNSHFELQTTDGMVILHAIQL